MKPIGSKVLFLRKLSWDPSNPKIKTKQQLMETYNHQGINNLREIQGYPPVFYQVITEG